MRQELSRTGGIYIHVPFCSSRCGYCSFFTAGARLADWPRFRSALLAELDGRRTGGHEGSDGSECSDKARKPEERGLGYLVETLYIGGGTPSLMPGEELVRLVEGLEARGVFRREELREFTVEANPDDVDERRADAWLQAGVNRVSMGVQSFDAEELRLLGRRHDPDHVSRALEILRPRFDNISIDLIYSLPGQTPDDWERNLRLVLETDVPHVSLYSLGFEERSALTHLLRSGNLARPDEDFGAEMNRLNDLILAEGGLRRYETSNYARAGYESIHNSRYWSGAPYIGLGPSASSYDGDRRRRTNAPDLHRYLAREFRYEEEILTDEELREEYLLTRLRRAEGFRLDDYASRFGEGERRRLLREARRFVKEGLLLLESDRLLPTAEGLYLLDHILVELL